MRTVKDEEFKRKLVIEEFERTGSVQHVVKVTGVSKPKVREWLLEEGLLQKEMNDLEEDQADLKSSYETGNMIDELIRRVNRALIENPDLVPKKWNDLVGTLRAIVALIQLQQRPTVSKDELKELLSLKEALKELENEGEE